MKHIALDYFRENSMDISGSHLGIYISEICWEGFGGFRRFTFECYLALLLQHDDINFWKKQVSKARDEGPCYRSMSYSVTWLMGSMISKSSRRSFVLDMSTRLWIRPPSFACRYNRGRENIHIHTHTGKKHSDQQLSHRRLPWTMNWSSTNRLFVICQCEIMYNWGAYFYTFYHIS